MRSGDWTWLEVAKLSAAALTPLLLFVLGVMVNRASRRVEDARWADRKVVEKRLDVYDELAPPLNDIYCFFAEVGHYREISPPDLIARKRAADRIFHVSRPLFEPEFQSA